MANDDGGNPNGHVGVEIADDSRKGSSSKELTLFSLLNRLIGDVFYNDQSSSASFLQRIKSSLSVNLPLFPEASRSTGKHVIIWARRGSPLRALLVVSIGTIALLALSGILIFTLFFLAATFNAIIISLIISLAAAGGFLALFFALVAAIYVGALSIAGFVICTATISAIIASAIVAGWIGFFWTLFLAAKKSFDLAKHSFAVTGSAVNAWHSRHHRESSSEKSD